VNRFQPVAHELLVEGGLRTAGPIFCARPESRGVRRKHLVRQDQLIPEKAKLEFRVGDDDAASLSVLSRSPINPQRKIANTRGDFQADLAGSVIQRNILIVS